MRSRYYCHDCDRYMSAMQFNKHEKDSENYGHKIDTYSIESRAKKGKIKGIKIHWNGILNTHNMRDIVPKFKVIRKKVRA